MVLSITSQSGPPTAFVNYFIVWKRVRSSSSFANVSANPLAAFTNFSLFDKITTDAEVPLKPFSSAIGDNSASRVDDGVSPFTIDDCYLVLHVRDLASESELLAASGCEMRGAAMLNQSGVSVSQAALCSSFAALLQPGIPTIYFVFFVPSFYLSFYGFYYITWSH